MDLEIFHENNTNNIQYILNYNLNKNFLSRNEVDTICILVLVSTNIYFSIVNNNDIQ